MDLLKRELAPIVPKAWELIDEEARRVLSLHLGGRKLVDFDGPHGWKHGAVNLGTLDLLDDGPEDDVHLGIREVLPLGEVRIPIRLDIMDLDAVARGNHDPDLEPVVDAAEKVARLEDGAIFDGSDELSIEGIIDSSSHDPFQLPEDPTQYPRAVVEASEILRRSGVDGPYGLALGPEAYNQLAQAADDGYPIRRHVADLVDGPTVWVPALEGAVLLSVRGGDFILTVGQDLSIGYAYHRKHEVELYITESFTFRVQEPAAAIHLAHEGS